MVKFSSQWLFQECRDWFGVPKKPNTEYYLVLRKSEYRIQILLFGPTIWIVFEYQIFCHTLHCTRHTAHTANCKLYTAHCRLQGLRCRAEINNTWTGRVRDRMEFVALWTMYTQVLYMCTIRYCIHVHTGTVHIYTHVLYTCTYRYSTHTYIHTGTVHIYTQVLYICTHRHCTNVHTTVHMYTQVLYRWPLR